MNLFIAVLFNLGSFFALKVFFIANLDKEFGEFFLFFEHFWESLVLIFDSAFIFFIDGVEISSLSTVVENSFVDEFLRGVEISWRLESFKFLFWGEKDCMGVGFLLGL